MKNHPLPESRLQWLVDPKRPLNLFEKIVVMPIVIALVLAYIGAVLYFLIGFATILLFFNGNFSSIKGNFVAAALCVLFVIGFIWICKDPKRPWRWQEKE